MQRLIETALFARMVSAHRSSVTTALNQLLEKGVLSRGPEGFFILRDPIEGGLARYSEAPQGGATLDYPIRRGRVTGSALRMRRGPYS